MSKDLQECKLCDFGLAKMFEATLLSQTQTGGGMGTAV
jgi:hypothetical protein